MTWGEKNKSTFQWKRSKIFFLYIDHQIKHQSVSGTLLQPCAQFSCTSMEYGKKLVYKGEEALKEIEKLTSKADEVQTVILKEILKQNVETEYMKKYMKGSKDVSEFKRRIPVITYKNIYPYIRRIANGEDSSLITARPIIEMLCRYLCISFLMPCYFC